MSSSANSRKSLLSADKKTKDDDAYIQKSWDRCRDKYRISPESDVQLVSLTDHEVKEHREPMEKLIEDSIGVFDRIRTVARRSGYTVLVTDIQGVVVKSFSESSVADELGINGLRQGTMWSESIMGTNGLGTCLTEKKPVTVYAEEHYGSILKNFSCSAAPLIAPDGSTYGAIDLSTYASGNKLGQGLALNLVCETADDVEALLFREAYEKQRIISMSFLPMMAPTNSLIAVNESDTIIAATTPLLFGLGCKDRFDIVGKRFQEVFDLSFEQLEASLFVEHYVQVEKVNRPCYAMLLHSSPIANTSAHNQVSKTSVTLNKTEISQNVSPLLSAAGADEYLIKQAERSQKIVNKGISILLNGETGTGKEVWARALHNSSNRSDKPFVTLNCAAIPESLIESELFGYGAGTFTGGLKAGKVGKIQASDGGTLFLDEIGDMPIELQARLLRVLAESEIIPLGEVSPVKVNLNVICATHRDLKSLVGADNFREDLFYRISGFKINLPSLRERQDKSAIINKVLTELCSEDESYGIIGISDAALEILCSYHWPGNIRQLKNVLQYSLCICDGPVIDIDDLPEEVFVSISIPQIVKPAEPAEPAEPVVIPEVAAPPSRMVSLQSEYQQPVSERDELIQALEENRWVVTRTAKALNISRSTLHRKIKKYNLALDDHLVD
ncbi:MAG: sigma-54-dependent Fis family transcriptional regulator [Neptuniibacter sp.]